MPIAGLRLLQDNKDEPSIAVEESSRCSAGTHLIFQSGSFRKFEDEVLELVAQLNTILSKARDKAARG